MKKKSYLLLLLVLAVLFIGCDQNAAIDNKGILSIHIKNDISKGIESITMDASSYVVTASSTEYASVSIDISDINQATGNMILDVGEWDVKVIAKNNDGVQIGEGSTTVSITPGNLTSTTIQVKEYTGTGSLSVEISAPSGLNLKCRIQTPEEFISNENGSVLNLTDSGDDLYSGLLELDNGFYFISIEVGENIIASENTIRIVKGHTTEVNITLESNGYLRFEITVDITKTPEMTLNANKDSLQIGETLIVTASCSNVLNPEYTWFVNHKKIENASENKVVVEISNDFIIGEGVITCVVTDKTSPIIWSESISFTVVEKDEEPIQSGDLAINSDGSVYCINKNATSITIPSSIDGVPVTSIADGGFKSSSITSIVIPDSVKHIGNLAFAWCYDLTEITIPNSVESMGGGIFYACHDLKSVTLPNSIKSLDIFYDESGSGYGFFHGCGFSSIELPNELTSIGDYAFYGCTSLTDLNLPTTVEEIGKGAIYGCYALTSISIPNGVKEIKDWTFGHCHNLKTLILPDSIETIGEYAVYNCMKLEEANIPANVKSIGDYAFGQCSSLSGITIPNSVVSIGSFAFSDCSSLSELTIPDSVTSIKGMAFLNCPASSSINLPEEQKEFVLLDKCELSTIVIPDSFTSIGRYAFYSCSSLTEISIPDSVTYIDENAFRGCNYLGSIYIDQEKDSLDLSNVYVPSRATVYWKGEY